MRAFIAAIIILASQWAAFAQCTLLTPTTNNTFTADKITFNDTTIGRIAAPSYGNVFIADFYLAATNYPSYFTATEIYNVYHKFILAKDGSGNLPISISPTTAAAGAFYSGFDTNHAHTGGDPIFTIPSLMLLYYTKSGLTTTFTADLAILKTALQAVPRNGATHLVSAGTGALTWITWGFQDNVQKTGDDLIGSLLYYQAATDIAAVYTANGDSTNAAIFTADAALIAANIDVLWNAGAGMYYAATIQNAQIDVNGSAFAVYLGLASPHATAIANYLATNQATLFNTAGFVRQSPTNWGTSWSGGGNYDDNFWSWGNFWVLNAIKLTNLSLAVSMANKLASSITSNYEYFVADVPSGASNNLESPTGTYRFILSNPLLFPPSPCLTTYR